MYRTHRGLHEVEVAGFLVVRRVSGNTLAESLIEAFQEVLSIHVDRHPGAYFQHEDHQQEASILKQNEQWVTDKLTTFQISLFTANLRFSRQ